MAHTGDMRVQLRLELDCSPDAAWDALRRPSVLSQVMHPWMSIEPVTGGLPAHWSEGSHPVAVSALIGRVPVGEQDIDLRFAGRGDTRVIEDRGGPTSGALAVITRWRHRMAVSPAPGGRTLYRDRLDVSAGVFTPVVWAGMWVFWQWRARQIRRLSRRWSVTGG